MEKSIRYSFLDELRGFLVICMVFFHALFIPANIFGADKLYSLIDFFSIFEPYFASLFIIISGLCCVLSRSNFDRGIKALTVAFIITGVTVNLVNFGIDEKIYFGIIHLLAVCMITAGIVLPIYKKINPIFSGIINLILFYITYHFADGYLKVFNFFLSVKGIKYGDKLLAFGFNTSYITMADYFPIFPWAFMFFAGVSLGIYFNNHGFPNFFIKTRIKPFEIIGKHALVIYILHQPILFLVFYIIDRIIDI